jgi:hypothetical protein
MEFIPCNPILLWTLLIALIAISRLPKTEP